MRGDTHSLRPFKNPSYIDYLVGWRYLVDKHYRVRVHNRWADQPWFISGSEMLVGLGSVLLSTSLGAILLFLIWDVWFK
ncbi:MAG: hypothetical protein AB2728_19070 [Candidatus Thiodiazotropha sp.]|nr:hypothetical protein [Candidatus Thiodiazotropha taylori]MBT3060131.1 hypothetical protein [Candidatus Thiodiazotropha sp. (ex Lucina pensylvanica)]MBT3064334.1 hypothetical protein [Candidatus Thiodiazotropha sp. (ex Lucina pensylvanica)]